jgi:hypothetical protein
MNRVLFYSAFFLLYLLVTNCSEQPSEPEKTSIWEKVSTLPGIIGLVQVEDNIIYAACYAVGGDIFIVSSDLGKTWRSSAMGTYIQALGFLYLKENRGYISGNDCLYRSEDYGLTWNKDTILASFVFPHTIFGLSGIAFKGNDIYLGQNMSANMDTRYIRGIFKTTDQGMNWHCPNPTGTPTQIWAITIVESNIIISNSGEIYYSPDDCETWIEAGGEFEQNVQIQEFYQIGSRIFGLGDRNNIYYSDNGGEYWFNCSDGVPSYNQSENNSLDVSTFTSSENYLFILRDDGVIYYTRKDNFEWKIFNSELPVKYYWKLFVVEDYLYYSSTNELWRTKIPN